MGIDAFNPNGEGNATRHADALQARKGFVRGGAVAVRAEHHAIPTAAGGDAALDAFERQARTHGFSLIGGAERTALHHPLLF